MHITLYLTVRSFTIRVGDGGRGEITPPPNKNREKFFSGKYVNAGILLIFRTYIFVEKCLAKWALSADIRFRPKAVVTHSAHLRFRRAAIGKFGGCRK